MTLAIIDYNRTIFDPVSKELINGAIELLVGLSEKEVNMVLFSKQEGGRETMLDALGVRNFFSETVFVPEKSAQDVLDIMSRHGAAADDTYLIGDHLHDIRIGNQARVYTIRYRQGAFADDVSTSSEDTPKVEVERLIDALQIIS